MAALIDLLLLAFMALVAVAVVRIRNLFAVIMLTGIYSLLAASLFVMLDAVDVALTEAAVGAGIMIILMLATLALTTSEEKVRITRQSLLALVVVVITGGALIYGTLDMPQVGDPQAPAHTHLAPHFTQQSVEEIGIPNMVTSVLASYRGLDTLGEAVVVLTAAVAVILVIGSGRARQRKRRQKKPGSRESRS